MAFDEINLVSTLETMRSLDLFREESLARYLSIAIRNKLMRIILEPADRPASKPVKVKPPPKLPLSVSRVPAIEKNIALGRELRALRAAPQIRRARARRTPPRRRPDVG